ncbi:hypothetical protein [Paraburkholderia unamae]|uniref:Uncharacterized protein n=1 Tax=Paraburkholderia unamae TaxID=219649 RepID=A0ACC6RD58_9BURK
MRTMESEAPVLRKTFEMEVNAVPGKLDRIGLIAVAFMPATAREQYVGPVMRDLLTQAARTDRREKGQRILTRREFEVITHCAMGPGVTEIAGLLERCVKTIRAQKCAAKISFVSAMRDDLGALPPLLEQADAVGVLQCAALLVRREMVRSRMNSYSAGRLTEGGYALIRTCRAMRAGIERQAASRLNDAYQEIDGHRGIARKKRAKKNAAEAAFKLGDPSMKSHFSQLVA